MLSTLSAWLTCFERRAANPLTLPESVNDRLNDRLSAHERARLARSIAIFQLGESSEGRTLLELARRAADRHHAPELVGITECFIREEQRHAALLRSFMEDNGIPPLQRSWTQGVFRVLRRFAGFELAITVLITAEMIGVQYYRALLNSTRSKRLRALCSVLMQDEALHLAYESELLLSMRRGRAGALSTLTTILHGCFHAATALVVWYDHRQVLRYAGHTPVSFLRTCLTHYALYFLAPRPRVRRVMYP
jgi:rubrerythrin